MERLLLPKALHDDSLIGPQGSAWLKTPRFSVRTVQDLEETVAASFDAIKNLSLEGSLTQEETIVKLAHDVGSSFGMRSGCRESFSERFAHLAVNMASLFIDTTQFEDPEMPAQIKKCFNGDQYTAAIQFHEFLQHLNAERDDPRDDNYVKDTANVLSILTRYAVEVDSLISGKK